MLRAVDNLTSYAMAAGEPFLLSVQVRNLDGGAIINMASRPLVLAFYAASGRDTSQIIEGVWSTDAGGVTRFARDGLFSEGLYGKALTVDLLERVKAGRERYAVGALTIESSARDIGALTSGVVGRTETRITMYLDSAGIPRRWEQAQVAFGGTVVPVPAPVFTTGVSIASDGTPQVGEQLTGIDGVVTNGVVVSRRWLSGNTALSTNDTYFPTATGIVTYEATADGPGGNGIKSTANVTVAAATVQNPAPTFTTNPSITNDGTPQVGETLTGVDGVISGGTVSGRRWLFGGEVVSTAQTLTPVQVGTYTFEVTATGAGGQTIRSAVITVAAASTAPAPAFTTSPSITPASGTVGATFTANNGTASNATGYTRRWLLDGTQIGTGATVTPVTTGSLVLEVTATGATNPAAVATSAAVTVTASVPAGPITPAAEDIAYAQRIVDSAGSANFETAQRPALNTLVANLRQTGIMDKLKSLTVGSQGEPMALVNFAAPEAKTAAKVGTLNFFLNDAIVPEAGGVLDMGVDPAVALAQNDHSAFVKVESDHLDDAESFGAQSLSINPRTAAGKVKVGSFSAANSTIDAVHSVGLHMTRRTSAASFQYRRDKGARTILSEASVAPTSGVTAHLAGLNHATAPVKSRRVVSYAGFASPALTDAQEDGLYGAMEDYLAAIGKQNVQVQIGGLTATGFRATLVSPKPANLRLLVSNSPINFAGATALPSAAMPTIAKEIAGTTWFAHVAKVEAAGLSANTQYYHAVEIDGVIDMRRIGRIKTAPAVGTAAAYSVAYFSCIDVRANRRLIALEDIAEQAPLVAIDGGDAGYWDLTYNRSPSANTQQNMRYDTLDQRRIAGKRRIIASMAYEHQQDDHDFAGNNNGAWDTTNFPAQSILARAMYSELRATYPLAQEGTEPDPAKVITARSWWIGRDLYILPDLRSQRRDGGTGRVGTLVGKDPSITPHAWWDQFSWVLGRMDFAKANGAENIFLVWTTGVPNTSTFAEWIAEYNAINAKAINDPAMPRLTWCIGDQHQTGMDDGRLWGGPLIIRSSGVGRIAGSVSINDDLRWLTDAYSSAMANPEAYAMIDKHDDGEFTVRYRGRPTAFTAKAFNVTPAVERYRYSTRDKMPAAGFTTPAVTGAVGGTAQFTVKLDWISRVKAAKVDWTASDGRLGTATLGINSRAATIGLPVLAAAEVTLTLSNPQNCELGTATTAVLNDDGVAAPAWAPATAAAVTDWVSPADDATTYSNTTFTTPATVGGTVAGITAKKGGSQLNSTAGPILEAFRGRNWLRGGRTPAKNIGGTSASSATLIARLNGINNGFALSYLATRGTPGALATTIAFHSATGTTRHWIQFGFDATNAVFAERRAEAEIVRVATAADVAATDGLFVMTHVFTGSEIIHRVNGAEVGRGAMASAVSFAMAKMQVGAMFDNNLDTYSAQTDGLIGDVLLLGDVSGVTADVIAAENFLASIVAGLAP